MDIIVQEYKHADLIIIRGSVDSATAPQLAQALEAANDRGVYKLVIDMEQLEYMSSAGFRVLLAAQRNSKRYNRGEVALIGVPDHLRSALEIAGFSELRIFDNLESALEFVGSPPAGGSTTDAPPPPPK